MQTAADGIVTEVGAYGGLFLVSFLAATVLPAQSEIGLAGMITSGDYVLWILVLVASVGNTLGAVVNWALGRGVERFHDRRWFPVKPQQLDKATGWYRRYGRWSLLLSWAPFVGDPLTVAAGVLREPFWSFLFLVTLAKTGRYLAVTAISLNWV